jgi:L-cysteine/cystine lyase
VTGLQPYAPDAQRLAAVRAALPSLEAGIYLDTLTCGPLPSETALAMADSDAWDQRTGRGGRDRAADVSERQEEARGVLAALLGASPEDIFLTHGLADSLALARRLVAGAGPSTAPARSLHVVPHVDPLLGTVANLSDRVAEATERGTLIGLDAGTSAGVRPLDVAELGVACVALTGQRWLLGPEGTGALWIDRHALPDAPRGPFGGDTDPLPRRAVLGLARSVGWLEMYVGLPWLYERTARLGRGVRAALAAIEGVELLTPVEAEAALVTFRISGWPGASAVDELGARAFAILEPPLDGDVLRISFGAFNSEVELGRLVETVALLAAHTPATLPRRPALVVLPGTGSPA